MSRYTKEQIANAKVNDATTILSLYIGDEDMVFDSVEELLEAFRSNKTFMNRLADGEKAIKEKINELKDSKLESDEDIDNAMNIIIDFIENEMFDTSNGIYKFIIDEDDCIFEDNTTISMEIFIPDKWLEQFVPELADGTSFDAWSEEKVRASYLGALDFIKKTYNI